MKLLEGGVADYRLKLLSNIVNCLGLSTLGSKVKIHPLVDEKYCLEHNFCHSMGYQFWFFDIQ